MKLPNFRKAEACVLKFTANDGRVTTEKILPGDTINVSYSFSLDQGEQRVEINVAKVLHIERIK